VSGGEGDQGPGGWSSSSSVAPHERLVVSDQLQTVLQLPAVATEVLETGEVAAEVGALLQAAGGTKGVLQVGVHLNFFGKLLSLDLDERCGHRLHVGLGVVERDSATADGVLVFVRVDASVHNTAKQVIEDVRQALGIEHSMQGPNKHCLLRVQAL